MSTPMIHHYIFGTTRNILLGAGLSFAVQKENYIHIPLIFLTPSIYAGYHLYENKGEVIKLIKDLKAKN